MIYLWKKLVEPEWLNAHEELLEARAPAGVAVISTPGRKRLQIEIACRSRNIARQLVTEFGGRAKRLRRDWLKRIVSEQKSKPLKIGTRLVILRSRQRQEAVRFPYRLIIPAGTAFGTGEHVTTAMALRLLEQLTHSWRPGWSLVDLGTGSGILALAGKRFGAKKVLAIDSDPGALFTARENARLNKIDNIEFRTADARSSTLPKNIDIVTANLFSELLTEILPKLKRSRWLILSGVLREQEKQLVRATRRHKIDIVKSCRRGKWIAILAQQKRI